MVFSIGLVVIALYDVIFTLRASGDPTISSMDIPATTINNPGFRETSCPGTGNICVFGNKSGYTERISGVRTKILANPK